MKLTLQPLTPQRWPDLEALFAARGCAQARQCWCMYYRETGSASELGGAARAAAHREGLKSLVDGGRPPGLIGYRGGEPVGWVALGPREDFAKLTRSPVMKPVDDQPVWSVICFVVPAAHRGQGVARALLGGAKAWARRQGATLLEGYPMDKAGRAGDDTMWFGTRSMFEQAGFGEVARRKPERPVMRIRLVR
jgi:GNAT superfamily N-acetyltransferase